MNQARFRKTARLERLAEAYLRPKEKPDSGIEGFVRKYAFVHTANLSALILYGDPKIDEPLSFAWKRCLESSEWQKRREKYGGWDDYRRDHGDPFDSFSATQIGKYFRKYFLPDLPGGDQAEKFGLIFKRAPPWLLWFTYGDVNARILGIKLPDLSTVNRFIRDPRNVGNDYLPPVPFECHLRADGVEDEIASKLDTSFFCNRRGNCLGANLRPGPDGPTGNIAHECGAEERDFKILQRSGQCQRTARQGAVEIQIRVQEGRRQGRVTASGGGGRNRRSASGPPVSRVLI